MSGPVSHKFLHLFIAAARKRGCDYMSLHMHPPSEQITLNGANAAGPVDFTDFNQPSPASLVDAIAQTLENMVAENYPPGDQVDCDPRRTTYMSLRGVRQAFTDCTLIRLGEWSIFAATLAPFEDEEDFVAPDDPPPLNGWEA